MYKISAVYALFSLDKAHYVTCKCDNCTYMMFFCNAAEY